MPHIIVEYSDHLHLDLEKLTFELHSVLCAQPTVIPAAVKTRAIPVKASVVGDGEQQDKMIHIALKLLPGRDDDLRKSMAQALFDTARKITIDDRISLTVETIEFHAASYTK